MSFISKMSVALAELISLPLLFKRLVKSFCRPVLNVMLIDVTLTVTVAIIDVITT